MTTIEQTGKNLEEATQIALGKLGVSEDEVHVEILDEGSRGFLGIGQSPAKVRVTLKETRRPEPQRAEAPARSRQRQRPKPKRTEEKAEVETKPRRAEARPEAEAKPKRTRPEAEVKPKREEAPAGEAETKPRERTRPRRRSKPKAQGEAAPVEAPQAVEVPTEDKTREAAEVGLEVLTKIIANIDPEAKVRIKNASGGQVCLEVEGGDAGILIGKRGQTIDAIQYLVGVITHKKVQERIRLSIDVEGYRTRREEALVAQAKLLAEKVKEAGQEAVLDPLPAHERKVIHAALADDPDITTYSEGEEPDRRVVISPK